MNTFKKFLAISALVSIGTATAFADKAQLKADREAVNAACSTDASTANCTGQTVGHGLRKCLHAYKKTHAEFELSADCKTALEKLRADRKEAKK